MNRKRLILWSCAVLLLLVLTFSLWQIFRSQDRYREEAAAHEALLAYRPDIPGEVPSGSDPASPLPAGTRPADPVSPSEPEAAEPTEPFVNERILQLRADHPNALGWITVSGTRIDYAFVQGPDNDHFLRRDVDGNYLYAGVPFLDWRCEPDFSGPNTVIYGHNLRNGTMFGDLEKFRDRAYLEAHREVLIFLEHETIRAQAVACLVVDPDEKDYVYDLEPEADHLDRILKDARAAVREDYPADVRFLTLSTCGYEFDGARIVLVCLLTN